MDWSATLSLTTSHARTHRANYGSFSAAPLKRNGSGSTISIPESIPEHHAVQFESPGGQKQADVHVYDVYAASCASYSMASTLTITETTTDTATKANTFKMLLTSASSRIEPALKIDTATEDPAAPVASSYWLQERERMRLMRERRHLARNGSPTKAATLRDEDDPETSKYRTAVIMCSVPLLLVVVFVVFVLVFGDGSAVAVSAPAVLSADAAAPSASSSQHLRSLQQPASNP